MRRARKRVDESGGDAVALGVPLVLLADGAGEAVEAGIDRAVAVERAHQAAEQRGDRHRIVEPGAAVGDAQLDGRVVERGPHRPPDIARVRDDLGADQRLDEVAVVLVGAEQFRQAGARQLVIGGEPVADQAGQVALPERRGSREREQQRQKRRQPHDQIDAGVDVGHRHMHVHAAQHVARADHLQVVHDGAVARLRRHGLLRPEGEREGAHGGEAELALGGGLAERAAVARQMRARLRRRVAGRGDDLDLRLQHFGHHAVAERLARVDQKALVEAAHGAARAGVEHEIFLFHAERIHARADSFAIFRFPAAW